MKNRLFGLAIPAIALVLGMTVVGCGGGGDSPVPIIPVPQTVSYQSADTAGYTYILVITVNGSTAAAGDSYVLTIKGTGQPDKVSRGIISAIGTEGALTLKPNTSGSGTFSVTINNRQMTAITGTIAIEGGEPVSAPGTVMPQDNSDGGVTIDGWTWKTYTDGTFGGISSITMTQGSGNDSKKLTFSGNVQRIPRETWGYAGCTVTPNSANLAALKNADSFSFKCRGDVKQYNVGIRTSDIPETDWYQTTFTASTTENTITIPYSDLKQNWGSIVTFNKSNIKYILFEAATAVTGEGPFNITIWDLKAGGQEPGGAPQWTVVANSPFSTSQKINAIAYGNNTFVAVGGNTNVGGSGKVATSTDGTTWTAVTDSLLTDIIAGISSTPLAIAYGNGKFVSSSTGSSSSTIATSTDGRTWTAVSTSPFGTIYAIAYGNNTFVASNGNRTTTSTNGTTWTAAVTVSTFGTDSISAIAYGNGKFVAVGGSGKMATSTNGTTWTAVGDSTFGTSQIRAIAYGNDKFVAVGDKGKMTTSTDGTTWTATVIPSYDYDVYAIAYGNGKFVAGDEDGRLATSTDGRTWTAAIIFSGPWRAVSAIVYGNGKFVAGTSDGRIAYLSDN